MIYSVKRFSWLDENLSINELEARGKHSVQESYDKRLLNNLLKNVYNIEDFDKQLRNSELLRGKDEAEIKKYIDLVRSKRSQESIKKHQAKIDELKKLRNKKITKRAIATAGVTTGAGLLTYGGKKLYDKKKEAAFSITMSEEEYRLFSDLLKKLRKKNKKIFPLKLFSLERFHVPLL